MQVLVSSDFPTTAELFERFLDARDAPKQLESMDIALMNLVCAKGLPGSEQFDIQHSLDQLDQVADYVEEVTRVHFHKYHENPADFDHSEVKFKAMMMVSVLMRHCGIRYNPERTYDELPSSFFANSQDVFLTGFTTRPDRMGSCSSMPVLYVAIGRRLGYPLHLVHAKCHVFARWEGTKGVRFNIEGTNVNGMSSHPDSYYRTWPFPITDQEMDTGFYLQNLPPVQVLASFLNTRGFCFQANRHYDKALVCYEQAAKLVPDNVYYAIQIDALKKHMQTLAHNENAIHN